jgi:DNA invertase Pin-like site-specific DNA recombinase
MVIPRHPATGLAGTYGRVSLALPERNQDSPEAHDRINRQGALTHGLKIKPGYEFYDRGITGAKDVRRPGFERAIQAVVDREIEVLIVPALDRLSRRGMRHVGEVLDAVEAAGGRIIFVREGLDTSIPTSRAIIAFLAEQARSESQTLGWRITNWHETRRLQGRWTTARPYGYRVEDGRLVQISEEAAIIQRLVREFLNGVSARQLAIQLNREGYPSPRALKAREWLEQGRETTERDDTTWHAATIARLLQSPSLCGWARHKGSLVLDVDGDPVSYGKGIITPGERAAVLAEFERRTTIVSAARNLDRVGGRTGAGRPPKYLLTGLARCAQCGYVMAGAGKRNQYRCSSYLAGRPCPRKATINVARADAEVVRQLTLRLAAMEPDEEIFQAIADRWRKLTLAEGEGERATLEARVADVGDRIGRLEEARYLRGEFDTPEDVERWDRMMARLKEQRRALLTARDKLGPPPTFEVGFLLDTLQSREAWAALSLHEQRILLMVAADRVMILGSAGETLPVDERVRVVLHGEQVEGLVPTPNERRRVDSSG